MTSPTTGHRHIDEDQTTKPMTMKINNDWTILIHEEILKGDYFEGEIEKVGRNVIFEVPVRALLSEEESDTSSFVHGSSTNAFKVYTDACTESRIPSIAIADLVARMLADVSQEWDEEVNCDAEEVGQMSIEPISVVNAKGTFAHYSKNKKRKIMSTPFVFERNDVWCDLRTQIIYLRARLYVSKTWNRSCFWKTLMTPLSCFTKKLQKMIQSKSMKHVSTVVLQEKLRLMLSSIDAVSFIVEGSILPRKSGTSDKPMSVPPAIPFQAPVKSSMNKLVAVEMGDLRSYLPSGYEYNESYEKKATDPASLNKVILGTITPTSVVLSGLLIPTGISLIVGGGYHGKSTLLRAISAGVHNKVPGDGRELCVTITDAVNVRAEDGRYVYGCNISGFISNLPVLPVSVAEKAYESHDVTENGEVMSNNLETAPEEVTKFFRSNEASGSTSQATNVCEAIESRASCILVDEDVSAANFMARDGRMRALVMDESITPLLYRVNGLYDSIKLSTIVVVGGVGDWLDVPHQVLKLDRYILSDATEKARSISAQFSYGHVQYAGRGVVHRLQWERNFSPHKRRPTNSHIFRKSQIHLKSNKSFALVSDSYEESEEDLGIGEVDLSRCEQIYGKSNQTLGLALMLKVVLDLSSTNNFMSLDELVDLAEKKIDQCGFHTVTSSNNNYNIGNQLILRPRKHDILMAATRLRGLRFERIVSEQNEEDEEREVDRQRRKLAEIWEKRRRKKIYDK